AAGQPELVDAAADVAVAVFEQIEIFLHPLGADAARDLLIDRHRGDGDRAAHGMVLVPGLDAPDNAVPLEDVLVGIADHAGLERNDRIRNLEGRGRQPGLAGAIPVAGDDKIVVDLVADEGAGVGEMLRQIVADLAALRRDVGEAARGQEARGGKQRERMAAMDHGGIRCGARRRRPRCRWHRGKTMTSVRASWFETPRLRPPGYAGLLTMRVTEP